MRNAIITIFLENREIYEAGKDGYYNEHALVIFSVMLPGKPETETPMQYMVRKLGPGFIFKDGKFYNREGEEVERAYVVRSLTTEELKKIQPFFPRNAIDLHAHPDLPNVVGAPPSDRDRSFPLSVPNRIGAGVFDANSDTFYYINPNGEYVGFTFEEVRTILEVNP